MKIKKNKVQSFQQKLENQLREVVDKGGFVAATLSDEKGLLLSTVGNRILTDIISALSSSSLHFKSSVEEETPLADIDEVSCVSGNKARYINRYFEIDNNFYILSVITPPHKAYRRVTNQAIINLKKIITDIKKKGVYYGIYN